MVLAEVPFADLLAHVVDNRGRTCPTADAGRPLIATNCISNERLYPSYDSERFVSEETYRTWFRGHPLPGDLIFVCKGSPGRVALAPDPVDFCIAQDMVALRADSSRIYPKYLLAALRSPQVQQRIENMHVGTLIPHFKKGDFDKLLIPVPDQETQIAIGDTYYEFSEKIEQNRRTAQVLGRLARAIFQAWFVDFEPVRAKAEGATSFPSMPQSVFDALPTRFIDSEIGPVPHDWRVKSIAQIATFLNGLALQKYPPRGDNRDLRVLKIAQLRKGSTEGADWANGDVPDRYIVDDGDLLFSWSGTLEVELWYGGRAALNQHLFRVTSSTVPRWYCLLWIRHHLPWFRAIAASKATTMGHIQREHLQEARVIIAPAEVMRAADETLGALYEFQAQVLLESHKLAQMRDQLLLKLLSGVVRISTTGTFDGV
jgi:type I restriction enzyme S subunit